MRRSTVRVGAVILSLAAALQPSSLAQARTVDCFADEVISFNAMFTPPQSGLRVPELPGIVLGPPGDSLPVSGSSSAVSLGHNGWILLKFTDNIIVDGPGPDFIVFENAFFKSFVPTDPNQAFNVFAEPGSVAVSDDGVVFHQFPYDPNALQFVGQDATPSSALPLLRGLAGITPTFTGNWTVPDDPNVWDPNGAGGVSGAGGDAFDLATVGLTTARYVLITDLGLATGFAGAAEGFDLDAVVALNSLPVSPGPDSDGDGLCDIEETFWSGSDPANPDTDGDGVVDGVEAARCRNPTSSSSAPWFVPELDLLVAQPSGTTGTYVTWDFISSTSTYDVARGDLPAASASLPGSVVCVEDNSFNLTTSDHLDTASPAPGQGFFYLARPSGQAFYGRSSSGAPRTFIAGDCAP